MPPVPDAIASFLQGKRIAVTGVSRSGQSAANAVLKKLRTAGFDAIPVNPHASVIDGGDAVAVAARAQQRRQQRRHQGQAMECDGRGHAREKPRPRRGPTFSSPR